MSNNSTTDEKARELEERARNFYNKLAKDYEDDLEPDETFEFAAAFAESERSSAIKEVREECARAVCKRCANNEAVEAFSGSWIHNYFGGRGEPRFEQCDAAAIRALGEKI